MVNRAGFDQNNRNTLIALSNAGDRAIVELWADPVTHELLTTGSGSGGGVWGSITGTLSDQTDLQTALNAKGTVNSVTVTGANGIGVSGSPITNTGTIALTLGAITPTTVNGVTISGSSTPTLAVTGTTTVSGANTGDQTTSGTSNRISVSNGSTNPTVDISASYVGQASITTLGTVATGVWQGTKVGLAYGGTNADLSGTGGASNVLKQVSSGAAVTVGQLAASDLSNGTTGSGAVVLTTSPTLVTPALGTPSSVTLTNGTGLPISTGISGLASGIATFLATPSSANLATAVTDETGSGALVFGTSPTLATAVLGSSTATTQGPADNSTKVATTAYVDNAVLGQRTKEAAKYATTAALPALVYSNGSSGVGATLTAVSFGALSLDGNTPSVGDRVLVKNQVSTFQNGIYTVTTVGTVAAVFVMTRAADFDQASDIQTGDTVFVTSGTALANTTWTYNGIDSPVMGTDAITFAQAAGPGSYTAGNGISITGVSIAIDTSITVDKTTAQTLTNKSLTTPKIASLYQDSVGGSNLLTLPAATDTLVGKATTDTFTNKTYDTAGTGNSFSINGLAATANTGTGAVVRATSATLVTPALGTPSALVGTNITGTAASLTAGTVTTNANLTGPITSSGNATAIASQTGTGTKFVVDTSPTLVTPTLGVATATSINKMAITAPATSSTLAVADGKTLTASNTLTLAGTDSTTITFQGTDTYVGRATTDTLTNKRITARTGTTTSSATPTINTDNVDFYSLTAQTVDITSFTTNLSGTPTEAQKLWIAITGTAARAITWGTSFEASTTALPTTTVTTARLDVGFVWNTVASKWRCVAVA